MKLIATYTATLIVFVLVDLAWLGLVAKDCYRSSIGHLMGNEFDIRAAVAFYLIYTAGILFFAVNPALESGSVLKAATLGAAFGFFAYATYDLTNMATLKNWPLGITLLDIVWGSVLTGLAASTGHLVASRL